LPNACLLWYFKFSSDIRIFNFTDNRHWARPQNVSGNLTKDLMKQKYFYLFYILTIVQIILVFFLGYWPVFFITILATVTPGLVYQIFSKKGYTVPTALIISHFLLTIATTYISYQIFRLFVETMVIRTVHYTAFASLKIPVIVDCSLLLTSITIFAIGLSKSRTVN
jgi:hypothetical protein